MTHSVTPGPSSIVTLTMNPALDITTDTDMVRCTEKLRCAATRYDPGGGGINVARIAHSLKTTVTAVFPVGGPMGETVLDLLNLAAVPVRAVPISGQTRESFTVNERATGQQYRFVMPGPTMTADEQTRCLDALRETSHGARFVVCSGSLAPGLAPDLYQQVSRMCRDTGSLMVADTSGRGLAHIRSDVHLLKASVRELQDCAGRELPDGTARVSAARELITRGVSRIVVVSCGSAGALLVTENTALRFPAVPVSGGSGVGAGDAQVAAMITGLTRGWSLEKSMKFGVAAGAAMLLTPGTDVCRPEDVERLFGAVLDPVEID